MVVQSRSFRVSLDSKQSVSFLIFFCIIINQLTISLISEKEKDWSLTGVNWEYVKTAGHPTCIPTPPPLRWRLYIGHQTSHLNRSNDRVECLLERYLVKMNFYHPKRPSEFVTKARNRERRWIKKIHSLPQCLIEWSVRCILNRSMLFWHLSQNQIRKGKKKVKENSLHIRYITEQKALSYHLHDRHLRMALSHFIFFINRCYNSKRHHSNKRL